jgi:hypothetical protein
VSQAADLTASVAVAFAAAGTHWITTSMIAMLANLDMDFSE